MGPDDAQAILDALDGVIVEYSAAGVVTWASPSLLTVLGYDPAGVVGTRFRLPAPPAASAPTVDPLGAPDGWGALVQTARADGSPVWLDVVIRHLSDGKGRTLLVGRDATVTPADGSPADLQADIVQRLDPENRTVWISASATRLTGWSRQEFLGETKLSRIHPADTAVAAEQLIAVRSGQPEVTVEVRLRQRSGTYLWWRVTARRTQPQAQPCDILLYYRNIDAQVHEREEAQRQARLFRCTLDAAANPMAFLRPVWDSRGEVVDLPLVDVNQRLAQLAGRGTTDLVGAALGEVLPRETVAAITRAAGQVMDDGQAVTLDQVGVGDGIGGAYASMRLWRAEDLLGITWDAAGQASDPLAVGYVTSATGRLEQIDDGVRWLLGFTAPELVGTRLLDLAHPRDTAALEAARSAVESGRTTQIPVRLRTSGGHWAAVTVVSRAVVDARGAVTAIAGTWRGAPVGTSVPGRWWRPILDTSLDPCVVLQPVRDDSGCIIDFAYVDANEPACDYNQVSRETLLSQTVLGLLPDHRSTGLIELYLELVETGNPLIADDFVFPHAALAGPRHLDIRGVKLGDELLVAWRDISDRMQAEQRLVQSERRYRLLAENASEVVLQSGSDGRIEWVSPSVRQVLGYRPEDLVGRRVSELLPAAEVQRLREEMADNVARQRPGGERRMRLTTADGKSRWMSALGHALRTDTGEVVGGVDALRDIHDQVIAQQSLAASQTRLQMLLHTMAEGVIVRDAEGVVTQCNPAAEAILGLPEDHIVGRAGPLEDQGLREDGTPLPPEEFPEVVALRTGRSVRGVVMGVRLPDDEVSWRLIDTEILREGASQDVTGVVSTFIDITDRIRAAQQMQQAEARFRLLAENASDFVLMADERGQALWVSPSVEQILGWQPEQLVGGTPEVPLHPADRVLTDGWRQAALDGQTTTDRVRVRHLDGTYRWFLRSAHPVRDDPRAPNARVAAYRDVSAEVEAEELLAASERRYRLLAETMTDLVEEYDPDWYLVWASPSALPLLGFSPQELVGSFAPNLIHPDDDTAPEREALDVGLLGNVAEHRRRVRRLKADGTYVWVDSSLSFRYDEHGKHVATYITSRDVDAQVRAEDELARSQKRFSRMFLEHDAIMLLIDPATGAIVDANRAASRFYGYSRDSLASMNISEINMEPVVEIEREIKAAVTQERNFFTFPHRLADGTIRTVEIHSSTIDDGDRTLLFSIIRDTTDDVAAREQLAASEQRYRLLAENATDFVVFAGMDGAIKWVSPSARRVLGWQIEEVVGRAVRDFVHPGDLPELAAQQADSTAGAGARRRLRIRAADGAWRWFMASSKPVRDDSGTLTGRVTGFQDVQAETRTREELRRAHERLQLVLDSSGLGLWDWDMVTNQTVFNQRWAQIVGYDLSELEPTTIDTWFRLMHPDDRSLIRREVAVHRADQNGSFDVDVRMLHRDGHWVWVRDRGRIVERDDQGRPVRMTGTHEDITALKHATEALAASEQRFRVAMASAPVGMAVLDLDRAITQVNPALCALLGYDEHSLVGRNVAEIVDPSDDVVDRSARTRLRRTPDQAVTVEHRLVRKDGVRVWVQQSLNLVYGPGGRAAGYVSQFADITEAREARHRLRDLAGRDPLTDLLNRRELTGRLRVAMGRRGEPLACLFMDLDGLKQINDSHGHLIGDQVLRAQARRLRRVVGEADLVARYGGDEFVVVLAGEQAEARAQVVAERIHAATRDPIEVGELSISMTCSIGIATSSDGDFDIALGRADAAAYRAKRAGRDCTRVYDPQSDG